jgi:hypothetical protein
MEPAIYISVGAAGVLLVEVVLLFVVCGGFGRLGLAWQAFRRVTSDPAFAEKVHTLLNPPPPEPPRPPKRDAAPLRLLALLQRGDGRFLDFVLEDISAAPDDTLGAGVRQLHATWQSVMKEHFTLEPVLPNREEETVTIPAGFDPSAIRLTGNVTGQPPFTGTLKHHGWKVKDYKLAAPPEGQDEFVMAPAEVDIP